MTATQSGRQNNHDSTNNRMQVKIKKEKMNEAIMEIDEAPGRAENGATTPGDNFVSGTLEERITDKSKLQRDRQHDDTGDKHYEASKNEKEHTTQTNQTQFKTVEVKKEKLEEVETKNRGG